MRSARGLLLIAILLAALAGHNPAPAGVAHAQDGSPVDVFVGQDAATGEPRIYFVDALTGLSTVVHADNGQNFTLVGDYVMYDKRQSGAVMRARPDGTLEPHPFVRRAVGIQLVQWVAAPDRASLAWVTVDEAGVARTFVARADGSQQRQVPISTPRPPLTLAPVALNNAMTRLYYDAAHPLAGTGSPFATASHLVAFDLTDDRFIELAGEPACPCPVAVAADGRTFARLVAADGVGPFVLSIRSPASDAQINVPAPGLPYSLAGDLVLNGTGRFAVYSVASGPDGEPVQYALVLADIVAGQQYLLTAPEPERYRPLAFIDDDAALLLVSVSAPGTFKLDLTSREFSRVSDDTYLGTILLSTP